jgi:hypothetical protein
MSDKPAVDVAKEVKQPEEKVIERYGVKARIVPAPPGLVQDAVGRLSPPPVPTWFNEKKGRDEPNPSDPSYLAALEKYESDRGSAAIDALVMFGVELLDELPVDGKWVKKLKFLHLKGSLDLGWVEDWEDSVTLEFLFKRYVLIHTGDLQEIAKQTGVSEEAIAQAKRGFRSKATRRTD